MTMFHIIWFGFVVGLALAGARIGAETGWLGGAVGFVLGGAAPVGAIWLLSRVVWSERLTRNMFPPCSGGGCPARTYEIEVAGDVLYWRCPCGDRVRFDTDSNRRLCYRIDGNGSERMYATQLRRGSRWELAAPDSTGRGNG
jgi:hypothetical protein